MEKDVVVIIFNAIKEGRVIDTKMISYSISMSIEDIEEYLHNWTVSRHYDDIDVLFVGNNRLRYLAKRLPDGKYKLTKGQPWSVNYIIGLLHEVMNEIMVFDSEEEKQDYIIDVTKGFKQKLLSEQ